VAIQADALKASRRKLTDAFIHAYLARRLTIPITTLRTFYAALFFGRRRASKISNAMVFSLGIGGPKSLHGLPLEKACP